MRFSRPRKAYVSYYVLLLRGRQSMVLEELVNVKSGWRVKWMKLKKDEGQRMKELVLEAQPICIS